METSGNNERNKKLKILPTKKLKMENWKKLKNRKKWKKAKKINFDGDSEKHSLLMVETTDCWISISDWEVDGRCDDPGLMWWPIPGFFTSACCAYSNGCIRWMNSEQYIIFFANSTYNTRYDSQFYLQMWPQIRIFSFRRLNQITSAHACTN